MSRYQGKPLLRLLECYVLSAIGELQSSDEQTLEKVSPKLREVYGLEGQWREVIAQVMHFPANIEEEFRRMWEHNRKLAAENNETLLGEEFARMVVDDNFSESIG
jgi:hypothetical protein